MRFDAPHLLWLLPAALAACVVLYAWASARRSRFLRRFGDLRVVGRLVRGASPLRRALKRALFMLGVALLVFALARPQFGTRERPLRRRGVQVLIAVDCSASMRAEDVAPSRIARARQQLRSLLLRLGPHPVGIIAFAGVPVLQCPITADHDMALNLLGLVDVDSVPVQGSAIGKAIDKAVETFQQSQVGGERALVLLTDGEELQSDAVEAAKKAAEANVRIYAVGIGSPQGAPIRMPEGGFKEHGGKTVNSRLDFEALTQIASITGGLAIHSLPSGELETRRIVDEIEALDAAELEEGAETIHIERFQWFLAPALVLLALEAALADGRRRRAGEAA